MDTSTNWEAARHPGPHRPGKVLTLTRVRFVWGHLPTRFTERAAVRDRTQAVGGAGAGAGETLEAGSGGDQLRSRGQARSLALGAAVQELTARGLSQLHMRVGLENARQS